MRRLRSKFFVFLLIAVLSVAFLPRAGAQAVPSVTVGDQVVMDSYVIVSKVVAAQDGWIVIHAGDKNGTVLGHAPVKAGENDNVEVGIDLSQGTPTVSAMLHIDAGAIGTYEFPGPDVPVKDASGKVVNVPFKIIGVDVDDQFVKDTKAVSINNIVAQQDGWIVIHATDNNGTVLGHAPIKAGLNQNITVPLDDTADVTEELTAMIHIDAGVIGKYEFPGPDVPPQLGGAIANEPFWTVDHVRVEDQKLADDGTFTVPYVLASKDGWIVIHANDQNGTQLGHAPVKAGFNQDVKVKIDDPTKITDKVSAMLHIDAGQIGVYEFPGPDGPVKDSSGQIIAPLFSTTGEVAAAATAGATVATPAATKSS